MKVERTTIPIKGFSSSGLHCGIRRKKKDLVLIMADQPVPTAGVFTKNKSCASPVTLSKKHLINHMAQAIIINSGNANACTGHQGKLDALHMAQTVANHAQIDIDKVLVSSTGVIGLPLPMDNLQKGIPQCVAALQNGDFTDASEGILTTDTGNKTATLQYQIGGQTVSLTAIAKGSGMIHPNMATMLGFIMTDASIDGASLQAYLGEVTQDTFNMVSVDGDTSTNDMVIAMASGQSLAPPVDQTDAHGLLFKAALYQVCKDLAIQIASDGEGATKLLEVNLEGASSKEDARKIAKSVVCSSLVKSAFFGNDANWGRIVCAMGYSGADYCSEDISVSIHSEAGTLSLMDKGAPLPFNEAYAKDVLSQAHVQVQITLNGGVFSATAWGCDLTYDYVKINGMYRT